MHVEEPGQQGTIAELDKPRTGRYRDRSARTGGTDVIAAHHHDGIFDQATAPHVEQALGMEGQILPAEWRGDQEHKGRKRREDAAEVPRET